MPSPTTDKPIIMVSNDDGVYAPGIRILARELRRLGRVVVVAPSRDQSAVSHALTIDRPLRLGEVESDFYKVDGTPTDAVMLAFHKLWARTQPDIVVSGINHGSNMGDDVIYSGTVAAAIEGCVLKRPAIACSMVHPDSPTEAYIAAARFARRLVRYVLKTGLRPRTLLNVNFPPLKGRKYDSYRFTRLGRRIYRDIISEKRDPRGAKYFWIGGSPEVARNQTGTDFHAIRNGHVSITPITLDVTDTDYLDDLNAAPFKL